VATLAKVPPGRAGRLWLRHRLAIARRGRDQLDRKLRILTAERQRIRLRLDQRMREWETACAEASGWLLRLAVLGGQDAVRSAAAASPAEVRLTWRTTMGVLCPSDAVVNRPRSDLQLAPGNAVAQATVRAYDAALLAGARAAATQEAARRVEAEITVTRQRVRALDKRWLPWLQDTLHQLDLSLEQAEQEDSTRLRRGVARTGRRAAP
jgi:V/A-type H+-transporting ATPase subunit D